MIKIYRKKIKNKGFYYLTEQIRLGNKYKKIQVYLGKNIPNDLSEKYFELAKKEEKLISDNLVKIWKLQKGLEWEQIKKVERARIQQKYFFAQLSDKQKELFWREFAIDFIFQSNAIEGSRLSQKEVRTIVDKGYIKRSLNRKEVIEVQNSLKAFKFILSDKFKLNQKSIKELHKIISKDLDIEQGYKTKHIIVNNKETTSPALVKKNLQSLIVDYKKNTKKQHPFFRAIDFHVRFEAIHPFSDGNGRVGRMILIWMLQKVGYGMILIKLQNRGRYFRAMDQADDGRRQKLYWFVSNVYQKTIGEYCKK